MTLRSMSYRYWHYTVIAFLYITTAAMSSGYNVDRKQLMAQVDSTASVNVVVSIGITSKYHR